MGCYPPFLDVKKLVSLRQRLVENLNSALSKEWQKVREYVSTARRWLGAPDSQAPPFGAAAWCSEALVHLARAVYVPELSAALLGTIPVKSDAPRVLDEYLYSKLQDSESEHSLRAARNMLDNATDGQNSYITSSDEAIICVEATIAVVNIIADLAEIDRDLITGAS